MNDLERDLRDVLHEDARRVPTPASAPAGLRRSVRRRQAVFGGVVGLSALAIIAGVVAGATLLLPTGRSVPAVEPMTSGTLNGITITYPRSWVLIDPDEAGLNGPGPSTELPRIVLALAPTDPGETFGCPGVASDGATLLMTVQEEPLALDGPGATRWPVDLEPLRVDASESACYPGWEFLRAGWTASGRTFEARVGLSSDIRDADREALLAAFASMTFAPTEGTPTSVVLDRGTISGEDYELIASSGPEGLVLTLQGESSGAGGSSGEAVSSTGAGLEEVQLLTNDVGGVDLVFGAVPADAVRVVRTGGSSAQTEYAVIDVPDEIDPRANAFLAVGGEGDTFEAFDAQGNVVAHGSLGAEEAQPPAPLGDGRHFGYVRSVAVDAGTIEFDLATFLSGEEANQAYQEATGDTGPVPNDHFVVNDNPLLRTLSLAPDLRLRLLDWNHCCETFFDGDLALFAQAIREQADVTDGDLVYRGQSQWWITVENGVVTEIEEQYSP